MRTTPGPGRVMVRGLLWGPLLGGVAGSGVWLLVCVGTLALPGAILTPFAFLVGAAVGIVPAVVGAGVVALAARRHAVLPADAAVLAGTASAGIVFDLVLGGVGAGTGAAALFAWWAGLTVLVGGVGAFGGWLVARPRWVEAGHPGPSSPLSGPFRVEWSPVDAHPTSNCPLDALGGGGPRRH